MYIFYFFFVKSFRDLITCASYCQKDGLCKAFTLDYNYCRIIENLETADIVKIFLQSFKAREVWIKVDDSINDQEYQDSFDQCPTPELIDDGICDSSNNVQECNWDGQDCCNEDQIYGQHGDSETFFNVQNCNICECLNPAYVETCKLYLATSVW